MSSEPRSKRSTLVRRYPALALVLAAAALAVLLPSALTVPQSGPSTLAEFAPVPGSGQGRSDAKDFGTGQTGGLGFGGGSAEAQRGIPEGASTPSQKVARLKRCVGNPPRQTEDELSPPCVAFFEGSNPGATAKGVSKDEVKIAIHAEGDQSGSIVDCALAPKSDDVPQVLACKAYMKYFNDRYQTYGRVVHLWNASKSLGSDAIDSRIGPFAFGSASLTGPSLAKKNVVTVGYLGQLRRPYRDNAPMFMTFRPDYEDDMRIAASYVCLRLAGRKAQHSGNPLDQDRVRVFGVWTSFAGSGTRAELLIKDIRELCGQEIKVTVVGDDRNGTTKMQTDGVTTVIAMDGVLVTSAATVTASGHGYFPEWMILGNSAILALDTNSEARKQHPAQWKNSFGMTLDYRRLIMSEQNWFKAYREGCLDCAVPGTATQGTDIPFLYDMLNLLFWGIQASGPRLTPQNMDLGLHAIPARPSSDPYRPAAYFAPGNWTFVKDAMPIWWDATGQPPGSASRGCYRLPSEGRRFRASEWPSGDALVKADGPCQGDPIN